MNPSTWVLYGASGHTGQLIAEEAVRRGHRPLLAGRNQARLEAVASKLGLESRAVPLEDGLGLRKLLTGRGAVVHAGGPFARTSRPMVDACIATRTHYLDITQELDVFQTLLDYDRAANQAHVVVLPGVGFNSVAGDCLAAFVASRAKNAKKLTLAMAVLGRPTSGTARSALGLLSVGGRLRRGGSLVPWALGRGLRRARFSTREAWVVPAPLGEIISIGVTTNVRDITTCVAVPSRLVELLSQAWKTGLSASDEVRPAPGQPWVHSSIEAFLLARVEQQPAEGGCFLWAEAEGETRAEAWLETPDAYRFTAQSAILLVERVLARGGGGFMTPTMMAGHDLVLSIDGTRRIEKLPAAETTLT